MHKSFKLAALAGALSMVVGGSAIAANHDLTFGGWTVTNGQIDEQGDGTSVCANATYDCNTIAAGSGFKQIQVTARPDAQGAVSGESYIMTIVTDQNADGIGGDGSNLGFYDVSFVKMKLSLGGGAVTNNNENGIAAQQRISEVTASTGGGTATSFSSKTDINTGWSTAATPVSIAQSLVDNGDTATSGDNFDSSFNYRSSNDSNPDSPNYGLRDGFEMSIDQVAGLASAADDLSVNDVQVFALRERQGTMLTGAAGSVDLLTGGTTSWVAGEDIKAIWLGQTINLDSVNASGGGLGSTFGYLSFENKSDTAQGVNSEFGFASFNAESAWAWDPAFNVGTDGGVPNICDPSGVTVCP